MQSHGILHAKTKICINLDDADFMEEIKETEDNRDILTNLREQYSIFSNKLFPMVKKWVVTCTKAGENSPSHLLRKAIDIKGGLHKPCGQCLECFEFSIHYFWFISDTLLVQ